MVEDSDEEPRFVEELRRLSGAVGVSTVGLQRPRRHMELPRNGPRSHAEFLELSLGPKSLLDHRHPGPWAKK